MSVVYARIPVLVRLKKGHKMSLEIKRINDLEFQPIEFADKDLILDLEIAILSNAEMTVNCYFCHKPIPSGTGNCCVNCKHNRGAMYLG